MARILDFADGFESSVEPTASAVAASAITNTPSGNLAATNVQAALNELQGDIDTINTSKGANNGIATLDSGGKVPSSQLPAIAITEVYVVADITARDALTVDEGDIAKVTDAGGGTTKTYIYDGSSWIEIQADGQLATHEADTSTHGVSGAILGTTDPQVVTNKDIDGGTASNSNRLTIPKNTKTNLDGLTRKAATIVYATDESKAYIDNGSSLVEVGSSGSSTLSVSTKSSAYTATTSDDVILADATSAGFTLTLYAASGNSGRLIKVKKTDSTFNLVTIDANSTETIDGSTTLRLSTKNDCVTLLCDGTNWVVVERVIPQNFTTYTPTITWTSNATATGRWRRVGDSIQIFGRVAVTGTPTTATLTFTLPSGLTLDTAKLPNTTVESVGIGYAYDDNVNTRYVLNVKISSTSTLSFGPNAANTVTQAVPFTWAVNDNLEFSASLPISNWDG